jgi:serine/threonine protein kinase
MLQICSGVEYMHSQGVTHRDLKIENILVKDEKHFMIGDFGSATRDHSIDYRNAPRSSVQLYLERIGKSSTLMYRAPELVDQYQSDYVSESSDVWALGCIIYLLASCRHPFADSGNLAILN